MFFLTGMICAFSIQAMAMVTPKSIRDYRSKDYLSQGIFIGGESGKGFSLLNIKRHSTKSGKLERIIFEIGDHEGRLLSAKAMPGFFHIQVQQQPTRVIVDFSQMQKSSVDNGRLQDVFRPSPLIKSSTIVMDPTDGSTNIAFLLNHPVKILAFQDQRSRSGTTQIILDLISLRKKVP